MLVETEWPIKKGGWLVRINSYLAFYHFYALNIHRAAQGWTGAERRQMKQNVTHFLSLCQIVKLEFHKVFKRAYIKMFIYHQ